MPRPGVQVTLRDTPSTISLPTDTGVWFVAGLTDRGPITTPKLIRSINEFSTVYGPRVSYSSLYDCVEVFFREGGERVYVGRVVGPAATSGFLNLVDNVAAISLVATANGPGAWSNQYKVQVLAGTGAGTFVIRVLDINNVILEDSGDLATQGAAVAWSNFSNYIRLSLGASLLNPQVAAATVLSTGNDDRAAITDTQWLNALNLFTKDLGPGQVSAPGQTTSTRYTQLVTHATNNNRVALLDGANTPTVGTLQTAAAAINSRVSAFFAPWVVVPGLSVGTTRTIPPSALIAGLLGRNDASLGANRPAAGNAGVSRYAIDLSQIDWDDTNRQNLNVSSVNVIRRLMGGIRNYGWRALVNPNSDANWLDFGNGRLYMALSAELGEVGENYVFEEIDGQNGDTINGFHDALAGILMGHFLNGELFGDTAAEAFNVDTGPTVNTLATISANELHAVCSVKMSPMAEFVPIEIVKRTVTEMVV